ncbi:MAG: hypothetical protein R3D84_03510 [Paracoccaceae bacterium]
MAKLDAQRGLEADKGIPARSPVIGYGAMIAPDRKQGKEKGRDQDKEPGKRKAPQSGGYLQAPTLPQATAAAVMRSAQLRHPGGAFDIDLSASRVRLGLGLLDHLRRGHDLGVALGLLGEGHLRKAMAHTEIMSLRKLWPVRNPADPDAGEDMVPIAPVFDGLALPCRPNLRAARSRTYTVF